MLGCGSSLKIILVAYVLPEIVTHKLKQMNSESDKECILPVSKWKFWTHDSMQQPILSLQLSVVTTICAWTLYVLHKATSTAYMSTKKTKEK